MSNPMNGAEEPSSSDSTYVSGFLRKSKGNKPFDESNRLRYVVSNGFNVSYYKSETSKECLGHFDLRNVVMLEPVPDSIAPNAVSLHIAEGSSERVKKKLIFSFADEPSSKASWLAAWCSAVVPTCIDPSLITYGSDELAREFDEDYARQRAVAAKRNLLKKKAPTTQPLSPRHSPAAKYHRQQYVSYDVTVPEGAVAGDTLRMLLGEQQEVQIVVPEGAHAGAVLEFELPAFEHVKEQLPPATPPATPPGGVSRAPSAATEIHVAPQSVAGPSAAAATRIVQFNDRRAELEQARQAAVVVLQARVRGRLTRKRTPNRPRRTDVDDDEEEEDAAVAVVEKVVETALMSTCTRAPPMST